MCYGEAVLINSSYLVTVTAVAAIQGTDEQIKILNPYAVRSKLCNNLTDNPPQDIHCLPDSIPTPAPTTPRGEMAEEGSSVLEETEGEGVAGYTGMEESLQSLLHPKEDVEEGVVEVVTVEGGSDIGTTEGLCRYCFEPAEADRLMLEPCKCKGSMAYAHPHCLKKWLVELPKLQDPFYLDASLNADGDIETSFITGPSCEICRSKFDSNLSLIRQARKDFNSQSTALIFFCRTFQMNGTRAVLLLWLLLLTLALSLLLSLVFLIGTFTGSFPHITDKAIEISICFTFGLFWLAFCGGCYHLLRYR